MKIQANTIRPGNVIEHEGKQWSVLKIQLIQPGKGGAFIQVEMRDVASGVKTNVRWRTQDTVEKLSVDEREYSYLYAEGDLLTFMDSETYEQTTLPKDMLGDSAAFLQENMQVSMDLIEGKPVAVHLPQTVTLEVTEADPVVKGQTAASSYKPAMLSNGVRVMVPPFVEAGTRVVVNTEDGSYVERAKS
jgi:elongation factor P